MRWIKIVLVATGSFAVVLLLGIYILLGSMPNPIWYELDCGGIDPGINPACQRNNMQGYKKTCRFFICKKEISERPGLMLK